MERDKHLSKFSVNCADSGRDCGLLAWFMGLDRPLRAVFSEFPDAHRVSVSHFAPGALKKFHIKALKNSWWRHTPHGPKEEHFAERLWRHLQPIECRSVESAVGTSRGWVGTSAFSAYLHGLTHRSGGVLLWFLQSQDQLLSYHRNGIFWDGIFATVHVRFLPEVNKHKQIYHIKTHQWLESL